MTASVEELVRRIDELESRAVLPDEIRQLRAAAFVVELNPELVR